MQLQIPEHRSRGHEIGLMTSLGSQREIQNRTKQVQAVTQLVIHLNLAKLSSESASTSGGGGGGRGHLRLNGSEHYLGPIS